MQIRPAHADDVPELVVLLDEWGHPQPAAVVADQLADWQRTPNAAYLVAAADGVLVGAVAVAATPHLGRPGRSARIVGLVVRHGQRRQGVGAALVAAAEELARGWRCDVLELTSSRARDAAHPFYRALGYQDQSDHHARYLREL
jgi:GNAT superfamily N-acetyltransferase